MLGFYTCENLKISEDEIACYCINLANMQFPNPLLHNYMRTKINWNEKDILYDKLTLTPTFHIIAYWFQLPFPILM